MSTSCVSFFLIKLLITLSILMNIMFVILPLVSALSHRVGALQISIIIISSFPGPDLSAGGGLSSLFAFHQLDVTVNG